MRPAPKKRTKSRHRAELPPPPALDAYEFELGGDEYALFEFPIPEPVLPEGLTPAEQAVVRGVLAGLTNAQIARTRGTSLNTVANQLRNVFVKARVHGRTELVRRCSRRPARGPTDASRTKPISRESGEM